MPATLTYPGVYIEEVPSGVRTITGVATSITAFVGRAWRGPVDEPTTIFSYADYEPAVRRFVARQHHELRGAAVLRQRRRAGRDRARGDARGGTAATAATIDLGGGNELSAASVGTWGRNLVVTVDHNTKDAHKPPADQDDNLFNLSILDEPGPYRGCSRTRRKRRTRDLPQRVARSRQSALRHQGTASSSRTWYARRPSARAPGTDTGGKSDRGRQHQRRRRRRDRHRGSGRSAQRGQQDRHVCAAERRSVQPAVHSAATRPTTADNGIATTWTPGRETLQGTPCLLIVDAPRTGPSPMPWHQRRRFQCDRTRVRRHLFPAPAHARPAAGQPAGGLRALRRGRRDHGAHRRAARRVEGAGRHRGHSAAACSGSSINGLPGNLTDHENGQLNPLGINCLRTFPVIGHVVWGARTLRRRRSRSPSQWKYIPVRRLALFIEESLFRGTQWVVFEPNDEPLWAQIRLNVGAFMHTPVPPGRVPGHDARARPTSSSATRRRPRRPTSTTASSTSSSASRRSSRPSSSSSRSSRSRSRRRSKPRSIAMAQFSVNAQRFDPYKNFKFRVKWDGRYVAGVSKVSALKRTTEVVKHRDGGDPSTVAQVARPHQVRGDHARARRHPRHRVREVGEQGLELRLRPRRGSLAQGLPQGPDHRGLQRGRPARARLQGLPLLGVGVPGAARSRRQRQRGRDPDASSSRTRAGSATTRSPNRPSRPFTEPAV